MNFDASISIGDVLQLMGATMAVLTAVIMLVGSRVFVGRKEFRTNWRTLTEHIDEKNAEVRTAMQTDLGGMSNRITRELGGLEKQADERHTRVCDDLKRMELSIVAALGEARKANDNAVSALRAGERAELKAENTDKNVETARERQDRQIEALQNRRRETA